MSAKPRGSAVERWTAEEVKAKLRGRHAATQSMGVRTVPGPWTCIEELLGCDLVAFSAVQRPLNGPGHGVIYPRVGYEVKVSRADYRKELRDPFKRKRAVALTHAFYFAIPKGLLRPEERDARESSGVRSLLGDAALWVPEDVGLVEVHRGGCRVVHQAPVRKAPESLDASMIGVLARHVSSHPDPRHEGIVAADRALCAELRGVQRGARRWEHAHA